MSKLRTLALAVAVVAGSGAAARATVVINETFSYPDGNLVGHGAWTAHSAAGSMPVQVTGGHAVLNQGAGSREDVNDAFTALSAGGTMFAGFDFTNTGDTANVYFAHFLVNSSVFHDRLWVTAPSSGGNYGIGFGDGASIASAWASDLTFGTTYRAVIELDFDTLSEHLWINPVDQTSTNLSVTGSGSGAIVGFAMRQATGATSTQTVDNLIVATTFSEALGVPSPASAALLALGGLIGSRRRRS